MWPKITVNEYFKKYRIHITVNQQSLFIDTLEQALRNEKIFFKETTYHITLSQELKR